jgi:hypothetical protein
MPAQIARGNLSRAVLRLALLTCARSKPKPPLYRSRNAARATWGLVYLGTLIVLVSLAGLAWLIFSALKRP